MNHRLLSQITLIPYLWKSVIMISGSQATTKPMSSSIKVLFFGDIFGKIGRNATAKALPKLKTKYKPDFVIANAENIAHGRGVNQASIDQMTDAGIDFFTSGNHVWDKPGADSILSADNPVLIRPANYSQKTSGLGYKIIEKNNYKILVINLLGQVFIPEETDNPFTKADEIINQHKNENLNAILVDFHAEATSEKKAMGYHLDGHVSAVLGTHTHVLTDDEIILEKGTGYISDAGMTGPRDSVIGLNKQVIVQNFISDINKSADVPESGPVQINAVYIEVDSKTQKCVKIAKIRDIIEIR